MDTTPMPQPEESSSSSTETSASKTDDAPTLVSIIISNYNYARYIREAIDSALAACCPSS